MFNMLHQIYFLFYRDTPLSSFPYLAARIPDTPLDLFSIIESFLQLNKYVVIFLKSII